MDNDTRINLQYDIIQFLNSVYIYNDEEECYEEARRDSYRIMEIIEKHLGKFERENNG